MRDLGTDRIAHCWLGMPIQTPGVFPRRVGIAAVVLHAVKRSIRKGRQFVVIIIVLPGFTCVTIGSHTDVTNVGPRVVLYETFWNTWDNIRFETFSVINLHSAALKKLLISQTFLPFLGGGQRRMALPARKGIFWENFGARSRWMSEEGHEQHQNDTMWSRTPRTTCLLLMLLWVTCIWGLTK